MPAQMTDHRNRDGVAEVLDLLTDGAPLPTVLAACAHLVPEPRASTAVVVVMDGDPVIGTVAGDPAARLATDDRWWRGILAGTRGPAPLDFTRLPAAVTAPARAEGFESAWLVPLPQTEVPGCLVIWLRDATQARSILHGEDLHRTLRLARLAVHEHALRRQATTDPLTGLANRTALIQTLDGAPDPTTVAVVDLDRFKPVNDTHGHAVGDTVLQIIARRLANAVRHSDLVARLGGDEFAVVFGDAGTSPTAAERLVDTIEAPIRIGEALTVSVGASIGLATGPPREVLERADSVLYATKRGRSPSGETR